ncbi:Fur family transcriptional regulator [Rhizorhabdus argentea]|uniref:Fur family transcriptional regulator n=1 Tax=Rhizorhabdus argentea TaxID=1387174 RepID=UPI0030EB3E6B
MATAHDHHIHKGESLADAARRAFERAGEQWTPMRAAIFAALSSAERPASAYDLAEAVSRSSGRRVAANSVYRILDVFVAANLARRVESANAYIANAHPDCEHDCIFLVCDACGRVSHVDDDSLSSAVRRSAEKAGFSRLRPVIEVRGSCANCSEGDLA